MRVPEEGRGWRASQSTKQARVGLTEKVRSEQKIAGARQLAKQTAWKKIIPGRETAKAESECARHVKGRTKKPVCLKQRA